MRKLHAAVGFKYFWRHRKAKKTENFCAGKIQKHHITPHITVYNWPVWFSLLAQVLHCNVFNWILSPLQRPEKRCLAVYCLHVCNTFSADLFMASRPRRPRRPRKPSKLQKLRTNTRSSLQPRSEAASGGDNLTSFHSFAFSFKGLYMQCQFPNKFWTFLIRSTLAPSMVFSAENRKQRENEIGLWGPMRLWPITNFSWERVHFDAKSCTGCPGFPGYLQAVI